MRGKGRIFVLVFSCLLIFWSCGKREEKEHKFRVGLVFDVGGRGDKSFNDSAYRGLERAKKELGIYYEYIEPGEGSDRESALRVLALRGFDIIFGIGFMFSDDIKKISKEFPNIKFACVDYTVKPGEKIPDNLAALKFREEEGSFLVGAIAGLLTKTDIVGFVGGMDIPLIHKFEAGYRAGVKYVNPEAKVLVAYAGVTGEAFKNPSKGKELALSQYSKGADIIYHASGSTGLGVFEAAREMKKLAIGVDSDQYWEAPGYVLTSMIKRVDESVFRTIKMALEGKFKGGVYEFGLKENGVGYVYDENNKNLIPEEVIRKVEKIKEKIIKGEIKVPKTREELKKWKI
ncbi:MAG: BMP family ABC transporter substrate-binding protein [Caldiserica bacterium]|nr:MAG: BMP family ABC transporter substrate-binding protein [Caldisericota bacterium]